MPRSRAVRSERTAPDPHVALEVHYVAKLRWVINAVPGLVRSAIQTRAARDKTRGHLLPITSQQRRRRTSLRLVFLKALSKGCSAYHRAGSRRRGSHVGEYGNLGSAFGFVELFGVCVPPSYFGSESRPKGPHFAGSLHAERAKAPSMQYSLHILWVYRECNSC